MSMLAHVNGIMQKKGYLRVSGQGVGWFEKDVRIDGQAVRLEVSAIETDLAPESIATPVCVQIYDPKTRTYLMAPFFYDSLKAYLGVNMVERVSQELLAREMEAI